jgi:O-succinylbenzoic acid--CoA ligase
MSETCGGCVYDGRPLDGVQLALDSDGRIRLGGPVLARGYRGGSPAGAFTSAGGERWFRTDDGGRVEPDGRLTVLGRLDDVIVTGGAKIAPVVVETALMGLPEIAEAVVVGAPDPQWGQRVVAAVVLAPGARAPSLAEVRRRVSDQVGAYAAPQQLLVLEHLPLRGPGKPDRSGVASLAQLSGPA